MGEHEAKTATGLVIRGSFYDILNLLAKFYLPGAGAAYFGLSKIWGFPYAEEIVGSIAIIDTFLGIIVAVSKSNYKKSDEPYSGSIVVDTTNPAKDYLQLQLDTEVTDIEKQGSVTFKVKDVKGFVRPDDAPVD